MTIADEIQALSDDRTAIQNAISAKGGTVTSADGFDDFAAAIGTIPSGGTLQAKTGITPTTSSQTIVPDSGYDGLSSVQINAISPTKSAQTYTPGTTNQTIASGRWLTGAQTIKGDANLVAGNIKKDVSIFGVTGTYEGSGGGGVIPAYDYRIIKITITNSNVGIYSGSFSIWAYRSEYVQFPQDEDYFPIMDLDDPNGSFTVCVPPDAWGICIEVVGTSPDGVDYDYTNITVSGNLTYYRERNDFGYCIKVDGNGTISIDGVDFDP